MKSKLINQVLEQLLQIGQYFKKAIKRVVLVMDQLVLELEQIEESGVQRSPTLYQLKIGPIVPRLPYLDLDSAA